MGLLSRILKTPNDDEDGAEDQFQAEESGLLMASLPPEEEEAPAANPEAPASTPSGAAAGATPEAEADVTPEADDAPTAEGDAEGQPQAEEEKPPEAAGDEASSEPQEQAEPSAGEPTDDSSDDLMEAFKSTLGQRDRTGALHDDLVDVPMAELLAEARSIRDALTPADEPGYAVEEAEEEAA